MAKYAFVVPPFMGHVGATLSIGAELISKGHEVAWISAVELPEYLISAGGEYFIPKHEVAGQEEELKSMILKVNERMHTSYPESIKFIYEEVLIPLNRYLVPRVDAILDTYKPDVVINDLQVFAGAISAYNKRIPYATSITTPLNLDNSLDNNYISQWEENQILNLQREFGIFEKIKINSSPLLNLVYCPSDFSNPDALPDTFHFVGPAIKNRPQGQGVNAFDWEMLHKSSHPKVLISLGTLLKSQSKAFFQMAIEAFTNKKLTIVAVAEKNLVADWPSNFIVQEHIPQLAVLPFMDAVITHAGANTTCEALAHGLPLVVIPMAYDQYHIAAQVEASGCGIRLKSKRLKIELLQNAIERILTEPAFKNSASTMQEKFGKAGGTEKATELLEQFAKKSKIASHLISN